MSPAAPALRAKRPRAAAFRARPPQRRQRAATATRRREILDAALRCFLRRGVRETTLEHIRRAARASTGSIYHLFASKDEIAYVLFVEGTRRYHDRVLEAVTGLRSARDVIRAIVAAHLAMAVEEPELSLYLTQMGMADETGEIAAEHRAAGVRFAEELRARLAPFVAAGEIVSLPPELFFPLIVGPAAHLCRSWLRGRYRGDPLAATDTLALAAWKSLQA